MHHICHHCGWRDNIRLNNYCQREEFFHRGYPYTLPWLQLPTHNNILRRTSRHASVLYTESFGRGVSPNFIRGAHCILPRKLTIRGSGKLYPYRHPQWNHPRKGGKSRYWKYSNICPYYTGQGGARPRESNSPISHSGNSQMEFQQPLRSHHILRRGDNSHWQRHHHNNSQEQHRGIRLHHIDCNRTVHQYIYLG